MTAQRANPGTDPPAAFPPKLILVAVDVGPDADASLAETLVDDAVALAAPLGASLLLVHAGAPIDPPVEPPVDLRTQAYRAMVDIIEARNAAAARSIAALTTRAEGKGARVRSMVVTHGGTIARVLVEVAREQRADLIIMTTHARRGLKRLLLGSVAERTAHEATIPVLLLPARAH
jgi:nucleotide-binding universal stress UspA family protein